ncbi:Uncharacterised protein [Streptococcus pyogenes]|nr:hypothetical protein DP15_434 [Streptococcus pyogenes]SQF12873.1 Uncharacterised protein [Streptococcus pyogenes]SQF19809.1 Uncharacterised protein [Streptococcus pyogenes]SUO72450.1 Uncharacterised protein [Streptococcus pyogenes]VED99951.1 Uncharacterised protein [Streptococcus pyogenes]
MGGVDRGKSGRSDEGIRQIKKDLVQKVVV